MTTKGFRIHLLPALVLAAATMAVYGRIIGHDFIRSWDDYYYVTANDAIKAVSWDNIRTIFSSYYIGNYAPVQMLSYMFDHALWGLNAGGFLFVNLSLHLLNGLLTYRLLYRLHSDMTLAFSGAAVFLLHPLQVETVAWVSQRKSLLAMLFFLLAWEFYRRYRESSARAPLDYAASLAAFLLGGLSKSVVVFFPLVLLLYEFCFFRRGQDCRWLDKIPFFGLAALFAGLAIMSQQPDLLTWGGSAGGGLSGYHGGSFYATFLTMLTVVCRYIGLILWPVKLSVLYDHTVYTSIDGTVIGAGAVILILCLLSCLLMRRNERYGFWPLFFAAALLPVAQIVPLVTLMNDRYLYFPMIAVAALAGTVTAKSIKTFGWKGYVPIFPVLIFFAAISYQRAGDWRDDITLWRDAAEKTPMRTEVWQNLAVSLQKSPDNHKREAIAAYERSYELQPRETTLYMLGTVYLEIKEYDTALHYFESLLQISPDNVMGLTGLGNVCLLMGKFDRAESALLRAHALQPEAMQVVVFLARLYLAREDWEQSRRYYYLLEKNCQDAESAFQLACLESHTGHADQALLWLEKALQRGYRDVSQIYGKKELALLRKMPSFAILLQKYLPGQVVH